MDFGDKGTTAVSKGPIVVTDNIALLANFSPPIFNSISQLPTQPIDVATGLPYTITFITQITYSNNLPLEIFVHNCKFISN